MNNPDVDRICASAMTVSDKIRALDATGLARAEIARLLGKRYQHVRNVLEADKLHGRPAASEILEGAAPGGLEEPSAAFQGTVKLHIDRQGGVRLPPEVMAALGSSPGGVLIAELRDDGVMVFSRRATRARIDALMAPYRDPTRSIVDELIADRRAEAAREDGDG